jgi:hypothetical protein
MLNYDDKRNFYRMMVNSEVSVTILDDEVNSQFTAVCRDLSATGLAIEMESPVETGTQLKVHIESTNASIPSLHARGEVVRCAEDGPDNYLVGVAIQDLD